MTTTQELYKQYLATEYKYGIDDKDISFERWKNIETEKGLKYYYGKKAWSPSKIFEDWLATLTEKTYCNFDNRWYHYNDD